MKDILIHLYTHTARVLNWLNMPYDVVGNAAGFGGSAFTDRVADTFNSGVRHHRGIGRAAAGAVSVFRRWAPCETVRIVYFVFSACWRERLTVYG